MRRRAWTGSEPGRAGSISEFLDIHPPYPERRALVAAEIEALPR